MEIYSNFDTFVFALSDGIVNQFSQTLSYKNKNKRRKGAPLTKTPLIEKEWGGKSIDEDNKTYIC